MLTDTALRNLKPKSKIYKASDRDGVYVTVSSSGTVTFRYDYRLNGRRETLTIGRYGPAGISLALAREKLIDAKKTVAQGKSPALEKQREKRRLTAARTFGELTGEWLVGARMADSTRAMRKSIVDRDILPAFENRQLNEITADDLRALCNKVKARGAPATAVHVRDIVRQIYAFAILHGEKARNLANLDFNIVNRLRSTLAKTECLIAEAQGLAYDVQNMDRGFARLYPERYAATVSGDQMLRDARERWRNTLDGLHTAMRIQAQVSQNLAQDESALDDLASQSQSATGALQAKQSIQAQQLQITQDRAASLELAR
uniref:Core-binding (CB) domain-containing protein n=1 Tax=Steinernema glaseri TaxID=37863 RepID=A0A1I8AFC5_9BILA